jgi:hypothetical protein
MATVAKMAKVIGKTFTIRDTRTDATYEATVTDAKEMYGKLRVQVDHKATWFEPNWNELKALEYSD